MVLRAACSTQQPRATAAAVKIGDSKLRCWRQQANTARSLSSSSVGRGAAAQPHEFPARGDAAGRCARRRGQRVTNTGGV